MDDPGLVAASLYLEIHMLEHVSASFKVSHHWLGMQWVIDAFLQIFVAFLEFSLSYLILAAFSHHVPVCTAHQRLAVMHLRNLLSILLLLQLALIPISPDLTLIGMTLPKLHIHSSSNQVLLLILNFFNLCLLTFQIVLILQQRLDLRQLLLTLQIFNLQVFFGH